MLHEIFDETCENSLEQNFGMEKNLEEENKAFDELKSNQRPAFNSQYQDLILLGIVLKKKTSPQESNGYNSKVNMDLKRITIWQNVMLGSCMTSNSAKSLNLEM